MAVTDLEVCEIVLAGTVDNEGVDHDKGTRNVFQFYRDQTTNPWTGPSIMTAFASSIGAAFKAAVSEDSGGYVLSVRNMNDALNAPVTQAMAGAGAITGERLPSYVSVCIHLLSGLRGKSYRGRKHISPIAEDSTDGDVLSSAAITLFNALGAAIINGFTDSNSNIWKPAIVSFTNSDTTENPVVSYLR